MGLGSAGAFVGRRIEIARLTEMLANGLNGVGTVGVITGEAGAGKSALLDVVVERASEVEMRTVVARCEHLEIERPYGPVRDALGVTEASLVGPAPTSRTPLEVGAVAAYGFFVGEQLLEQLEALTASGPTLLVVEDLHWADPATVQLVHLLAERVRDLPLVVLGSARTPLPGSDTQRLVDIAAVEHLALPPLETDAIAEIVVHQTRCRPGPRLQAVLDTAGGNPLLVLGLLDALTAGAHLDETDGFVDVIGPIPELRPGASVAVRVSELDRPTLRIIQAAAILGMTIDPPAVADLIGRRASELLEPLDAACIAGILTKGAVDYVFRHDLHRQAVLDTMPEAMRLALHLEAARSKARAGAPAIEVAEHYALGARPGDAEAVVWLQRAAAELVHHDPGTALSLLDVAFDICGPHPREDLLLVRVRALTGTGRLADTEALARSLLREGLDRDTEAQLHRELGLSYLIQGRSRESVAEGERYLALVTDPAQQPRIQAEMAFARFVDLDHPGARAAAEIAVGEGRRLGDLGAQVAGGSVLAWLDEFRNDFGPALDRASQILALVRQPHGADGHVYQPWFVASLIYLEADLLDDVLAVIIEGRAVAERDGFAWSIPAYDAMAAYRLMRAGEHDDAAAVAEATLGYIDGVDGWGVALWCHAFVAQVAVGRGKFDEADQHIATAEYHLTTGRAQFGFEQSMIAKARLAERRGDPDTALTVLGDTWDLYGAIGVLAGRQAIGPDLVRLACSAGAVDRATDVVSDLDRGAERAGTPAFRAFAAMGRSWLDADPDAAVAAAELITSATPRRATAADLWDTAAVLLRGRGRVIDADAAAGRAVELYSMCGADADAQRLAATITGRRVRVAERPRFGWDALTATERRVVELIGEGLANGAIATDLFVSRRTVESHVSAAYRKLEVTSRVELARLALGHGRT